MAYDLLIIGAGLSGLFAGCLAARRGKRALIVARGLGSLHVGAGTVGVLDGDRQALEARLASPGHPYGLAGRGALESALAELKAICAEANYPLHGDLGETILLPTAAGSRRKAGLVPETMLAGDLSRGEPFALADLPGFRDFSAALAAANLNASAVTLPLPGAPSSRDAYATDLARRFDRVDFREQVISAWGPILKGQPRRIGLPAVLGLERSLAAKQHLETGLGVALFEIPTLPPSVPGMRLFEALRADFQKHGGRLIVGPEAMGRIENRRAAAAADAHGRRIEFPAGTVILASGGFLSGGLVGEFDGKIRETVFGLPVAAPDDRRAWTSETFLDPHPFLKFGVRVDKHLQPLGDDGKAVADNLRAIGSVLAGADRLSEGSREGIALATAYRAVESVA